MENISRNKISGKYRDTITYLDGRIEVGEWNHNIIVNSVGILLAALMKQHYGYNGITHWAVGSGEESWDVVPVEPVANETYLTNEIGRNLISSISFLNESDEESINPTNKLRITAVFSEVDCNGTWREFGLFGGNASLISDTGIMVDKKHHDAIQKTTENIITREIHLTFS